MMNLQFIGPATLANDGNIQYLAKLDGVNLLCHFSYEVLEDVDTEAIGGEAMVLFNRHQLKLLSIAEQKIMNGLAHDGQIHIYSNDLPAD
jgi:hypothetical protein